VPIGGYLIIVAIAVALTAQNLAATVVSGTVMELFLGVSPQRLIENAIAAMVLAIVRPLKSVIQFYRFRKHR
jgi:hypothetical protein